MPNLIRQHNILKPLDDKIELIYAKNKTELIAELQYDPIAYELIFIKDGEVLEGEFDILENDVIAVKLVPRGGALSGSGLLRTVAMIAIAIAAPQVGLMALNAVGATTALSYAGAMSIYYGAMVGTVIAGGMLVNAVLPVSTPSLDLSTSDLSTSTTYGWNAGSNTATQGGPIPKIFGTHKINPPLISKYIETIDDKQYFNMLFALNDGIISSCTNIKINDEDISNFDGISYSLRNGFSTQPMIESFGDTRYDKPVGQKLSTDYDYATTTGNDVTEITAIISFPKGLYYMNDSANAETTSVKLVIEYSSDGTNWTPMYGPTHISTYSDYYLLTWNDDRQYFEHYNSSGTYIDNVLSLPSNAIRLANGTSIPNRGTANIFNEWYGIVQSYTANYETISAANTSAFRKTFKRSNLPTAQYTIRAKLYEAPINSTRYGNDVYFEYLEEGIPDDFIYPSTALLAIRALATDQLSGGIPNISCVVSANSNNPALICKQILLDSGEVEANIDTATFNEWETECNTQGYKCNIVFDSVMSVRSALDTVSLLGRASIQQFGSKYAVIMDKKNITPVQVFTFGMGNIIKDTFKQTFLPITDRSNVIQVTYFDEDNNYERTVAEVSNANYDNVVERKLSTLNLIGCTNRNMALKHAQYQLNCNRYITETIEFEAYQDALCCKYGDIIGVSHDVPAYGESGRILSIVGNTITLDRDVVFESGKTYGLIIRNKSNQIQEVTAYATATPNIVTTSTLNYTFEMYDNYSFGELNKINKLYRVIRISTGNEFTRLISAVEYVQDVYNDATTINPKEISSLGLKSLYISDYIRYKANTNNIEIATNLKWTGESLYYIVGYKKYNSSAYNTLKVYDTFAEIIGLESGQLYNFYVKDSYGKSIYQDYNVIGKLDKPTAVENASYSINSDELTLRWDYPIKPIDFKQFEIYSSGTLVANTQSTNITIPITKRNLNYSIFAVDTSNVKSDAVNISVTIPYLNDVTTLTTYYNKAGEVELSWLFIESESKPIQYEIRKGNVWETSQVVGLTYDRFFKPNGSGQYLIKAKHTNIYGYENYSSTADTLTITANTLVRNVIATFNEKTDNWAGTKTDISIYDDAIFGKCIILNPLVANIDTISNFDSVANVDYQNGSVSTGTYYFKSANKITLNAQARLGLELNYKLFAIDLSSNIDLTSNFDAIDNIDGNFGALVSATPQIKVDGGSWINYIQGDYVGQTFEFRIILNTLDSKIIPVITELTLTSDVPDKLLQGTNISISALTSINFAEQFNTDAVNVQATILDSVSGDYAIINSIDKYGFDIIIKNGTSTVSRNVNWIAQAY